MNAKIKTELEKNYTVDYIDRDDASEYYQVYNDDCEIMACCNFYDDGLIEIRPTFSQGGEAKCSDNSEDILLKNESDEYTVEQIISVIE